MLMSRPRLYFPSIIHSDSLSGFFQGLKSMLQIHVPSDQRLDVPLNVLFGGHPLQKFRLPDFVDLQFYLMLVQFLISFGRTVVSTHSAASQTLYFNASALWGYPHLIYHFSTISSTFSLVHFPCFRCYSALVPSALRTFSPTPLATKQIIEMTSEESCLSNSRQGFVSENEPTLKQNLIPLRVSVFAVFCGMIRKRFFFRRITHV